MNDKLDLHALKAKAKPVARYAGQLQRLKNQNIETAKIESAVDGATANISGGTLSMVVYGEPQSGKTEMMICLTAKLLDEGRKTIVHLMNDSVDLHGQNLSRFKASGLAPSPVSFSELTDEIAKHPELVVFCKKNARDLEKTLTLLESRGEIVVVDDEADYATPNAKINQLQKTAINQLVGKLIGTNGVYVGVTATPARLDLNSTFDNDAASWVHFPPHRAYTGQDVFFPLDGPVAYRQTFLNGMGTPADTRAALIRFLVTVAYLNTTGDSEENYTMLVHTSGKKSDHQTDRAAIQSTISAIATPDGDQFDKAAEEIHAAAKALYPDADAQELTAYVAQTISRANLVVLNSERDRKAAGENPAVPTSPFTVIVGGNIVSRGVTFPNLLSMYFTRTVSSRLQQDTYIQRARMFGARGKYLKSFELTIPQSLYQDWHRCFVFHRLALETISSSLGSPVWLGDKRISVASSTSINKATVTLDKGEMSFGAYDFAPEIDATINAAPTSLETAAKIQALLGDEAFPPFLLRYLKARAKAAGSLAIHPSASIVKMRSADQATISRRQGFIGNNQMQPNKYPTALHHIKIFYNGAGKAKLFYKYRGSIHFTQNQH